MKRTALPLVLLAALALSTASSGAYNSGLSSAGSQMWQQSSPGVAGSPEGLFGAVGQGIPGDMLGSALATGDFNGDQYMDVAVGVPGEDGVEFINNDGWGGRGGVHVFYGTANGLTGEGSGFFQPSSLGLQDDSRDGFGRALAAGDFNGDGFTDLAVGAPNRHRDVESGPFATYLGTGDVFMLFGTATGIQAANYRSFRLPLPADHGDHYGDQLGAALAAADFDGNGYDDLVVGVPGDNDDAGKIAVLYHDGGTTGYLRYDTWTQDSPDVDGAAETPDRFGEALAVGDIDANGSPDLVIGVPGEDTGAGAIAVFYSEPGAGNGLHPIFRGGDQLIQQNSVIDGQGVEGGSEFGDEFGKALAVGDFNGDGAADIAAGIPGEDNDPTVLEGAVAVLYGQRYHPDVPGSGKVTAVGNQLLLGAPGEGLGWALAAGDLDGDGIMELAAGVAFTETVRVFYGRQLDYWAGAPLGWRVENWTQDSPGIDGATEPDDLFGAALAIADFNGNGAGDLAVGAPGEDGDAGAVTVIYGTTEDRTPPVITPKVLGVTGDDGWFISVVTVSFTASDSESEIVNLDGCQSTLIQADGTYNFTCVATSAGGSASASVSVRRDATPPAVHWGAVTPAASAAGWHSGTPSFSYAVTDAGSGVVTASGVSAVIGEGVSQTATITLSDLAGNSITSVSPAIKVDRGLPQILLGRMPAADANGWNNTPVTVTTMCSDSLSGVALCQPSIVVSASTPLVTRFVADNAGNNATASIGPIQIDLVPPVVSATIDGQPGGAGWYFSATALFSASDADSGLAGAPFVQLPFSEGLSQQRTASFTDRVGNQTTRTVGPINVDATAPVVGFGPPTPEVPGGTGLNGWFTSPVRMQIFASDALSGVGTVLVDGAPANGFVVVTAESPLPQSRLVSAADLAGNVRIAGTTPVRIDTSAPVIAPVFSASLPVAQGEPLTLTYTCADPQSGISVCSGDVASGAAVDTSAPGIYSMSLRAVNVAGVETVLPVTYAVDARQCTVPASDVESWWTGDVDTSDLLGARHLAAVGTVGIGAGRVASAFQFTNDGYLTPPAGQPDLRLLSTGQPLSLSLWVKPEPAGGMIATRANDFAFAVDNHGFVWRRIGNGQWVKTAIVLPAGQWSHLAVTLVPSGAGVIYLNGAGADTFTVPAPMAEGPGDRRFRIGSIESSYYQFGGTPPPGIVLWPPTVTGFVGVIDEVMAVRRALTADEVMAAYAAGATGFCKVVPPALVVNPVAGDFGGEVTLSARRFNGLAPLAGQTIEFLVDGVVVGSAVTDENGDASLTLALDGVAAGNHMITARDAAAGIESDPAPAEVLPATPVLSWPAPASIVAGTPLGAVQLAATASVAGSFVFTPPAGTVLTEGTHALNAVFTPADTQNYTGGQVATSIVVTAAPPPPPPPPPDDEDEDDEDITPGRIRGEGFVDGSAGRHHFDFAVKERAPKGERGQLTMKVDANARRKRPRPDTFKSTSITAIAFSDDPAFRPWRQSKKKKAPTVDSVVFTGTGKWNGVAGFTFEAVATDRGEPGRGRDTFSVTIRSGAGAIVATVTGELDGGNIQSLRLPGRHR